MSSNSEVAAVSSSSCFIAGINLSEVAVPCWVVDAAAAAAADDWRARRAVIIAGEVAASSSGRCLW